MTIERFPGTRLSPKVLLAQVLEDADDLESVIIVKHYKNDSSAVSWSRQHLRDVAYGIKVLEHHLLQEMTVPDEPDTKEAS